MVKIEFSFTTHEEATAFLQRLSAPLAGPPISAPVPETPAPKPPKAAKTAPAPAPAAPAVSLPTAGPAPWADAAPSTPKVVEYADTDLPKRIASAVVQGRSAEVRELLVTFGAVDPTTGKPSGKFLKHDQLDAFSAELVAIEGAAA